jgi:hypothetical protein
MIFVSGESDGRSAALAQMDLQASVPDFKVLVARPAPINFAPVGKLISEIIGGPIVKYNFADLTAKMNQSKEGPPGETVPTFLKAIAPSIQAFAMANISYLSYFKEVLQQLALIDFNPKTFLNPSPNVAAVQAPVDPNQVERVLDLNSLLGFDPVQIDRTMGVCSVPLYEFTDCDAELFHSGKDVDGIRETLKRLQVFQYFFPAADQLALGLIDSAKERISTVNQQLAMAPEIGHPFGESEIVDRDVKHFEIVDALKDRDMIVEGEIEMELTKTGQSLRTKVKFSPREGLVGMLLRRFKFNVELDVNKWLSGKKD